MSLEEQIASLKREMQIQTNEHRDKLKLKIEDVKRTQAEASLKFELTVRPTALVFTIVVNG